MLESFNYIARLSSPSRNVCDLVIPTILTAVFAAISHLEPQQFTNDNGC